MFSHIPCLFSQVYQNSCDFTHFNLVYMGLIKFYQSALVLNPLCEFNQI